MAGVLTLGEWLGGPDNIPVEQVFPSTQRTLNYDFSTSIVGWNFHVDYQTLITDSLAFDRDGAPNFANSQIIGYFPKGVVSTSTNIAVVNASSGTVNITIPGNLYTGPIIADARKNVPINIVGVTWTDASTPVQVNTHRWALIQSWEPDVTVGDPTLAAGYTALTLG